MTGSMSKSFVVSAVFLSATVFLSPEAEAQQPRLDQCRDALIQGSTTGETILRCDDGTFYKRVGGRYQLSDAQGNPISRTETEAEPTETAEEVETLTPANPDFKAVPKAGETGLDTSRSGFKKVPGS